jgi:hypothetical protein
MSRLEGHLPSHGPVLKITVESGATGTRLRLEGKVAGPWVPELERIWHESAAMRGIDHITVDMSEVTFVDAEGRELLARLCRGGATLQASGCMMKGLVEDLKRSAKEQPGGRKR